LLLLAIQFLMIDAVLRQISSRMRVSTR